MEFHRIGRRMYAWRLENAVQRAIAFGGVIVADPFIVSGVAQIALIEDSVGALVGLWQPITSNEKANGYG